MSQDISKSSKNIFDDPEPIEAKFEKAFSQVGGVQPIFPENLKENLRENLEKQAKEYFKPGGSTHYEHMQSSIENFYKDRGGFVTIEPIGVGSVRPDLMGLDNAGNVIVGEIKKSKELQEGLSGYWSQWNSDQKFGGKSPDFMIEKLYSDKAQNLTNAEKGWLTVADGQLRHYCSEHGTNKGTLVVENYGEYSSSMKNALEYLKKQGRIKDFSITTDSNGNAHIDISYEGIQIKSDATAQTIKAEVTKIQKKAIIDNTKKAAGYAAAISAISSGAFNTFRYCKLVREGKITESEAVIKIATETTAAAADSALKAGANTAVQGYLKLYGTKGLLKSLAGKTNLVTIITLSAIQGAKDMVLLANGKITADQFYERNGKSILNTSAGVMGSAVGTGLGTSLGGLVGIAKAGAILGGVSGGLIAGIAMQFAITYGVEKPYHEMVSNTETLVQAQKVFVQVANDVFKGQVAFSNFLETESKMNSEIKEQFKRIESSGDKMKKAIDLL